MIGCYTDMPKCYKCSDLEEVLSSVKKLTTEDEHFEGFVVQDWKGNRIKLKSPSYMHLFFIKGEGAFTEKKILKIILDEEDDDILAYFPEYKVDFDRIRRLLSIYITDIKKSLKEAENRLKLDRKEYAKWALEQMNPTVLFNFYDNKQWDENFIKSLYHTWNIGAEDIRYGQYSLGMKKKLSIVLSLMRNPSYWLLDEPFNGLDMETQHMLKLKMTEISPNMSVRASIRVFTWG